MNVSIAIFGATINFIRSLFAGVDATDKKAVSNGVIASAVSILVFWLFFTYNVPFLLAVYYTWPALIIGGMFGVFVRRMLK